MVELRKKSPWKAVLAVSLLAFMSGLAVGVAGTLHYVSYNFPSFMGRPDKMPERLTAELRHKLGLSEDQAEKIKAIFEKGHESMMQARDEMRPRMETIMQQTRDEVATVLRPEQVPGWQKWYDELHNKFDRPPHERGDGPPPGDHHRGHASQ